MRPHCLGLRMLRGQQRTHVGMESSSLFSLNLLQSLGCDKYLVFPGFLVKNVPWDLKLFSSSLFFHNPALMIQKQIYLVY